MIDREPQSPGARPGVRAEIQALRAIAVGVVILGHSWPGAFSGGFVGVDVFFVISGFLITGHLVREVQRSDRISLISFWARRVRRILPAAMLVLGVVIVATLAFVPESRWDTFLHEMRASGLYFQNWQLASEATDYFAAAEGTQSPVQHYWSLSVEEQFYLVWPLLIGGAALLLRGRRRRLGLGVLMGVVGAASLAYSISATASDPAAAYFVTPTRVWEFALGGLLSLLPVVAGVERRRAVVSWLGLAAIAVAVVRFDSSTAFPGSAALLPVLGTVAVIWAGLPRVPWSPARLMALRPVQFMGDVSYSLYLWHWPLLILVPYALERAQIGTGPKVVLIVAAFVLAWATKRWVEDPVRSGGLLSRRPVRWTYGAALAGTAVIVLLTVGGLGRLESTVQDGERAAAELAASNPRCFGAASRDPFKRTRCVNPALADEIVPTPAVARQTRRGCDAVERTRVALVCQVGPRPARPAATAVIVGDSHAMHFSQAFGVVARRHNWSALQYARANCSFSAGVAQLDEPERSRCARRNREIPPWFRKHPEVKVAFMAQMTSAVRDVPAAPGQSQFAARVAGYQKAWASLPTSVERIVVLRDTPRVRPRTLDCIETAMDRGRARRAAEDCSVPRSVALHPDAARTAAMRSKDPRVVLVDINSTLCGAKRCYPIVGGVLAYKDPGHLTPLFARTLGPILNEAVRASEDGEDVGPGRVAG